MPIPTLITPTVLTSIRRHPHLPADIWYFITGVTLSVLNRPDELPAVLKCALETGGGRLESQEIPGEAEQLRIARRMREAMVKAGVVGGLPKSINALLSLKPATPASLLDAPFGPSPTLRPTDLSSHPLSHTLHRGASFFTTTYGKVAKRVLSQMDISGTEDLGIVARLMYGYILSNTNVLSAVETSWVLIAGLVPQDVNPQLKGHLKGAVNHGARVEEVRAVREVVVGICERAGVRWRGEVATL